MCPLPSRSSAWSLTDIEEAASARSQPARKRILVVDDDEATMRLITRFLRARDYEVFGASDGAEGLDRAVALRPDLVIADVRMPHVDGLEMVNSLKSDPSLRRIPVIFVTASTSSTGVAAAIAAGARHFLPKPIEMNRLFGLVKRALGA